MIGQSLKSAGITGLFFPQLSVAERVTGGV
jgi:hypothetical protein